MRVLIRKLIKMCDETTEKNNNCEKCLFKDECFSVSDQYRPHAWDENEQNTFCELMIRKDDEQ